MEPQAVVIRLDRPSRRPRYHAGAVLGGARLTAEPCNIDQAQQVTWDVDPAEAMAALPTQRCRRCFRAEAPR